MATASSSMLVFVAALADTLARMAVILAVVGVVEPRVLRPIDRLMATPRAWLLVTAVVGLLCWLVLAAGLYAVMWAAPSLRVASALLGVLTLGCAWLAIVGVARDRLLDRETEPEWSA